MCLCSSCNSFTFISKRSPRRPSVTEGTCSMLGNFLSSSQNLKRIFFLWFCLFVCFCFYFGMFLLHSSRWAMNYFYSETFTISPIFYSMSSIIYSLSSIFCVLCLSSSVLPSSILYFHPLPSRSSFLLWSQILVIFLTDKTIQGSYCICTNCFTCNQ